MKKRTSIIITLGAAVLLSTYVYLHFHPGLLSRPKVGASSVELQQWLADFGYINLDQKTAATNLYEAELEYKRDPEMLKRKAVRQQANTLLNMNRLHRQQSLCGAGQYFIFWRLDKLGETVEEIYYYDQFCYIQRLRRNLQMASGNLIFDTNGDGVLNASDTEQSGLKVWQDMDQDGCPKGFEHIQDLTLM